MKKNLGTIDRFARLFLAASVGILYVTGQIAGTTAIVLGVLAAVFAVTGFLSFCPIYFALKWSTAAKETGA